jgi:type IV pilus assembly protein PilV
MPRQQYRKLHLTRGFTLIEVLIAMVMFAIAVLGLATLQVGQIQANAKAKRRTTALTLAQDTIEKVRDGQGCSNTSQTQGAITYALECSTSSGPDGVQDITVTVNWTDSTNQSVVLQTRF